MGCGGRNINEPHLPAASSQVLQSPGCSLQGVWVGALRQQRQVRLHNGGVPQHLDAFRGLRQVRKGSNAIPLWSKRQTVEETNLVKLFVWSGLITTLVLRLGGSDQEGSLMGGRKNGRTRKKGVREQPNSLHTSSRTCVFVYVLQAHRCYKRSSAQVLPWTLLVQTQQNSFKHGPAKGTLFRTGTKCEEGRAERLVSRCRSWWSLTAGLGHQSCSALRWTCCAVITSALLPRTEGTFPVLLLLKISPMCGLEVAPGADHAVRQRHGTQLAALP